MWQRSNAKSPDLSGPSAHSRWQRSLILTGPPPKFYGTWDTLRDVPTVADTSAAIRRLRDLTRYRRALVQDRTREQHRVEKLLEDAQIKISSVLSDLHGVSGRAMMDALIGGERVPRTLARLAKSDARKKTAQLEEALRGFFTIHHATILKMMLDNSDRIGDQIAALDARTEETLGPFSGKQPSTPTSSA